MSDQRLDRIIGNLLRAGVALSAATVLAGGVWYLFDSGRATAAFGHFAADGGVRALLALPHPQVLILIGLLLLIATPVARVIFSVIAFVFERDWIYVAVTLVVLGILAYSIATGV